MFSRNSPSGRKAHPLLFQDPTLSLAPDVVNVIPAKNITKIPFQENCGGGYPFVLRLAFCAFLWLLFPQFVLFPPCLLCPLTVVWRCAALSGIVWRREQVIVCS
jgi:hypothetical protein